MTAHIVKRKKTMNDGSMMFGKKQKDFIQSLGLKLDFDNLSDDDLVKIEDAVADKLQRSGFDANNESTSVGKMCESILDKLA